MSGAAGAYAPTIGPKVKLGHLCSRIRLHRHLWVECDFRVPATRAVRLELGFRVEGSGFRVQESGYRVQGFKGAWFKVQGSRFTVQGARIQGFE